MGYRGGYRCEKCGSKNISVNLCVYWTLNPNDVDMDNLIDTLDVKGCDDGIHYNLLQCHDCDHEEQLF